MTTTVSPFAPSDYVRALEAAGVDTPWIPDRLEQGRAYAASGPSYSIRIDGQIACVLGLIIPWPHKAIAWAVWTPCGYRHPLTVHRLTVRYLRHLIQRHRIVRLEAETIASFTAAARWIEHLGMVPEGPLRPWAGPNGEPMQTHVWVHPRPVWEPLRPAQREPEVVRPDGTVVPPIRGGYGTELVVAMVVLSVAAAAASAYATYSAGQAQQQAHKYQAKVAENQAEIAKQQAEYAARQQRARDRKVQAAARAAEGASGLEMTEGSSLLLDIENARQAALNAEAVRYQTEATQRGLQGQAGLERWQGTVAASQSTMAAGATLLGAAASTAGRFYTPTPQSVRVQPVYDTTGGAGLQYP